MKELESLQDLVNTMVEYYRTRNASDEMVEVTGRTYLELQQQFHDDYEYNRGFGR